MIQRPTLTVDPLAAAVVGTAERVAAPAAHHQPDHQGPIAAALLAVGGLLWMVRQRMKS